MKGERLHLQMCMNINSICNFDPTFAPDEVRDSSRKVVRKSSGFNKPSKQNDGPFHAAIDEVARIATDLLLSLETTAPPKNREEEAAKAKARAAERFSA